MWIYYIIEHSLVFSASMCMSVYLCMNLRGDGFYVVSFSRMFSFEKKKMFSGLQVFIKF